MVKTSILDEVAMQRSITRMAHEILERNKGLADIVLVGIQTRGEYLAYRIQSKLAAIEGETVPVYGLDARPFRDDVELPSQSEAPKLDVRDKTVILVDDVLFTGRTARAALSAVLESGRARMIQLAVLIDRGHRELPIRPDFIGKNVPTSSEEQIRVLVQEIDDEDGVWIVREEAR